MPHEILPLLLLLLYHFDSRALDQLLTTVALSPTLDLGTNMQWIPELGVGDTETMQPIQGIEAIGKDRWALNCTVCKQKVGAKVQCSKCYTAFHPLCGRMRGFTMDMLENPGGPSLPLVAVLHCHKHCTPKPGAFGVALKSVPHVSCADLSHLRTCGCEQLVP